MGFRIEANGQNLLTRRDIVTDRQISLFGDVIEPRELFFLQLFDGSVRTCVNVFEKKGLESKSWHILNFHNGPLFVFGHASATPLSLAA